MPGGWKPKRLPMAGLIMFFQQVQAEIAVKIAPHGMDVIGVILGVVELHQKRRRLDAVIMALAPSLSAGPGEEQIVAGLLDLVFAPLRDLLRHVIAAFFE